MVAAMGVGQEGFAALGGPLDRPAHVFGGPDQRHVFGIQEDLRAETAADVGCDHPHLAFGQAEHEGAHQEALDVRILVGDVQRVTLVVFGVGGDRRTRLHRVGDQAVVDERQLGDVCRFGEGGVGRRLVAMAPVVAEVAGHVVMHQCGGTGRAGGIDHCGQSLVIDFDQLGGILRLQQRLGHHQCDLVADVAHLALGQHRMGRLFHRRAVFIVDQPAAGQAADFGIRQVLADENSDHAGRFFRRVKLDRFDAGMRMRRAQEHTVGLAVQGDVVGVLPGAGQKALVFAAQDGFANRAHGHIGHRILLRRAGRLAAPL